MVCGDEYTPIVIEVARKRDFESLDAFAAEILANSLIVDENGVRYRSAHYGIELALYADPARLPQVDGAPIDLQPARVYDSPFIEGDWDAGVVTLRKGERSAVLDFRD